MRSLVGLFGVACGLVAVALVARYGFRTADTTVDGAFGAFLFGAIAAGGLGGHAVAVRLWRTHRLWSTVLGIVSAVALIVNLTNSLGAIAVRGERGEAERVKLLSAIETDQTEFERLHAELAALPAFTPVTEAGVNAAREAVDAAVLQRVAECARRGSHCRAREADERARRGELAGTLAGFALTTRTARIEADYAAVRERLTKAGPTLVANPHGVALARLFRFPATDAATTATWQQLAVAVIVELLIVVSLVAFELMAPERMRKLAETKIGLPRPMPAWSLQLAPAEIAAVVPTEPRLSVAPTERPGNVPAIMVDCLEPESNSRVEFSDAYRAYVDACETRCVASLPPDQFSARLNEFCQGCEIQIEQNIDRIVLVNVRLQAIPAREPTPKPHGRSRRSRTLPGPRGRSSRQGRAMDPRTP